MPPRAKKQVKRKGSEASKPQPKKPRAAEPVEASSTPLVSLHLDGTSTDEPGRRSGRANAGTGGRNAQLEKIGALLEAPSRVHRPKGSTSLDSAVPVNPQAPELPRKGRTRHPEAAPPPYSSSATTNGTNTSSIDVGTMEPLQPLNPSIRQAGGRFGFATHAPTVPPDPDPNSLPPAVAKKVARMPARKIATSPGVADSVAPPAGFMDQNIDPALRGVHPVELRSSEANISFDKDDDEVGEGDNEGDNGEEDNDNDNDEEDEEDEISHQQIGWGGVGGRRTEHPGFSGHEPPSQPRVTRPPTPEFDFQYSRDEDDVVAQTSVSHTADPSMPSNQRSSSSPAPPGASPTQLQTREVQVMMLQPDDVLRRHHKKNGQPCLPDPETLELLHQVESDEDQPTRRSRTKRSRKLDGPRPTQLAWYGPRWKCFLEDAKGECRAQHALENAFPALVADLPSSVSEVLVSVLIAWDQDGKQFEAGIWPQQKSNMARLLYDDLATWRSDLKKSAASLAPQLYSLIPPPSVPIHEHAKWIEHAAAALIKGSLFLHFGLDERGKTRNFAHPALRELVIVFFYTGPYRIARRRPDIFRNQLPASCLALVGAAVYNCILDGLAKNGDGKYYPMFTVKEYSPVYSKMNKMLKDILQDPYHGPRLLAQLREWAEAGWRECCFCRKFEA
ncbi:hypothetical protein DEU56DRAFT_950142 [Suillus clintonianus]|uniref:uncharacterized protein n=1 Tax=Suillus clintonianus TaxID=1904413 RepID=UPI001B873AA4|nr:uncharacterized protein DEU56DRAFT_950142 [Suillus clintonianus]KAG2134506.1 hypothetical protein DEU56DRAFT_950142 [Suillus clintonianus]